MSNESKQVATFKVPARVSQNHDGTWNLIVSELLQRTPSKGRISDGDIVTVTVTVGD